MKWDVQNALHSVFSVQGIRKKEDYDFPKEENRYLIDLECGVYSCKETICRMSQYIEKLNKDGKGND